MGSSGRGKSVLKGTGRELGVGWGTKMVGQGGSEAAGKIRVCLARKSLYVHVNNSYSLFVSLYILLQW